MNFGQALEMLKNGYPICRTGWNGKGMWLKLRSDVRNTDKHIVMFTVQRRFVPWTASQTDLLSDDWRLAQDVTRPEREAPDAP